MNRIRTCGRWTSSVAMATALLMTVLGLTGSPPLSAQAPPLPLVDTRAASVELRRFTLRDLGAEQPLRLIGTEQQVEFPISIRNDEVVRAARIRLRFGHSPALLFDLSHLTLLVNQEVVGNVPLTASTAGGTDVVVEIDPRTLVGYSRIGVRAVLHYTRDCQDPAHSALWAVVAETSELELELQSIPVANDLALLPEPFFDPRDRRALSLPFVLPALPTSDELAAAGMIASWFGAMAEYRGWSFPALLGRLPERGHAVMIALRPRLASVSLEQARGAQVGIVDHPSDPGAKLLIVTADDAGGLISAARALTLGSPALAGSSALVREFAEPAPRMAYDAPRWVPTDRAVPIGERATPEQLQVRGPHTPVIRVPWDLPPDLFDWKSKGAKVDLRYRYTAPPGQRSTLDFDVNRQFARALPLLRTDAPRALGDQIRDRMGLPEASRRETFYVPVYKFGSDNELQWQYHFEADPKGGCEARPEHHLRGAIDADSTIDFSSLPHYTSLPNLKLFIDGAFPFSKYADLAQTVAVLPTRPSAAEVSAFLNVLGHVGDATGYPATRLRVTDAVAATSLATNADLLVFGSPQSQPLIAEWREHLPVALGQGGAQLQLVGGVDRLRARFAGRDLEGARAHSARMILDAGQGLGALMSFESPLSASRTVVMFAALDDARLPELSSVINDPDRRQFVGGDLTLLNGRKVTSYELAPQYTVGQLPLFLGLRWWFARQPLVLVMVAVGLSAMIALLLYRRMRQLAAHRRGGR